MLSHANTYLLRLLARTARCALGTNRGQSRQDVPIRLSAVWSSLFEFSSFLVFGTMLVPARQVPSTRQGCAEHAEQSTADSRLKPAGKCYSDGPAPALSSIRAGDVSVPCLPGFPCLSHGACCLVSLKENGRDACLYFFLWCSCLYRACFVWPIVLRTPQARRF